MKLESIILRNISQSQFLKEAEIVIGDLYQGSYAVGSGGGITDDT